MSPNTSPGNKNNGIIDSSKLLTQDEWIEIVEPSSKQRIYANLDTGICAKQPPDGAKVSGADNFSDNWWELYDEKTGKLYYYNPEQQRTVWTRPQEGPSSNGHGRRVLVIPVSRLQTFKKLSSLNKNVEKCDVSTQTLTSNFVSIATQTCSDSSLDSELDSRLRLEDDRNDTNTSRSNDSHENNHGISGFTKESPNHRQSSDTNGAERTKSYQNHHHHHHQQQQQQNVLSIRHHQPKLEGRGRVQEVARLINQTSIQTTTESKHPTSQASKAKGTSNRNGTFVSYFGPAAQRDKQAGSIKSISTSSTKVASWPARSDDTQNLTSTFVNQSRLPPVPNTHGHPSKPPRIHSQNQQQQHHQTLTTNNLSHYLVREARAMGIALISDDEDNDDDQDSEEDCMVDEDEDTDIRDDCSSHHGAPSDLNASIDLAEDSSEGWKSFSDQGSPNNSVPKSQVRSSSGTLKSPLHCETSSSSFNYDNVIEEEKTPASCMSQQLDHRKLVENFKKTRQTSSFGMQDTVGRSYMADANHAVQRIKSVADTYFHNHDKGALSNDPMRQLNALSTLPRPHKDPRQQQSQAHMNDIAGNIDADYDVVEENCTGYFHPSDYLHAKHPATKTINSSNIDTASVRLQLGTAHLDPSSPASYFDRNKSSRGSTFSVESFARENLTRHPKKGGLLFNRKVKWSRMISWTKRSIRQPMISSVNSELSSDAVSSFKLIQQYMGDRKINMNKRYRAIISECGLPDEQKENSKLNKSSSKLSTSNSSSQYQTSGSTASGSCSLPDRLRDELAYELVVKGCSQAALRDEIFVQLARQLTENPNTESVNLGLILMSILFAYFSPSNKFAPFLLSFLDSHQHPVAGDVCLPRLEKRLRQSSLTYCRKPADGNEISIVRLSITKWPQYCGVFGESLEVIMARQSCSAYLKGLRLPWILTTLGDKLLETGGAETEGIFRCAADHDLIAQLRLEIDCVDFRKINDSKQVHSLLANVQDPHVITGLLKLFFRQLQEPVFPAHLYEICLEAASAAGKHEEEGGFLACRVFDEQLSNLNKDVVAYLVRLLQYLARPEHVSQTKMDDSNLSMVWAPNLVRAPQPSTADSFGSSILSGSTKNVSANVETEAQLGESGASQSVASQSQSSIFEQTRQEMQFIRSLIVHLDTSFVENVV